MGRGQQRIYLRWAERATGIRRRSTTLPTRRRRADQVDHISRSLAPVSLRPLPGEHGTQRTGADLPSMTNRAAADPLLRHWGTCARGQAGSTNIEIPEDESGSDVFRSAGRAARAEQQRDSAVRSLTCPRNRWCLPERRSRFQNKRARSPGAGQARAQARGAGSEDE